MFGTAAVVLTQPIVLDCDHVAAEQERYRSGDELWCSVCCAWRHRKGAPAVPPLEADLAATLERRARSILADHAQGWHDMYDTDHGCTYPGCDDAYWLVSRLIATEPG